LNGPFKGLNVPLESLNASFKTFNVSFKPPNVTLKAGKASFPGTPRRVKGEGADQNVLQRPLRQLASRPSMSGVDHPGSGLAVPELVHPIPGAPSRTKAAGEAQHRPGASGLDIGKDDNPHLVLAELFPEELAALLKPKLFAELRGNGNLAALGHYGDVGEGRHKLFYHAIKKRPLPVPPPLRGRGRLRPPLV
jgi:hypothetical protein